MGEFKNYTTLRVDTYVMVEGKHFGAIEEVWGENKFKVGYWEPRAKGRSSGFFEAHELVIVEEFPPIVGKYQRLIKKQVRIENAINTQFARGSLIMTIKDGYAGIISEALGKECYKIIYPKDIREKAIEFSELHESEFTYIEGPLAISKKENQE